MSLPDIDFNRIRPVNGARSDGFEELCCQLASLEPAPPGSRFFRKGRGGDAGVECFLRLDNGDETGWQAKHLFVWDAGCASQLDKSIGTALKKHPRLKEYVVCLPFDLSDSRSDGVETSLQKWERWHAKWTQRAAEQGRELRITRWGKSELFARLASDDPARAGRVLYWFGVEMLRPAWFDAQFEKVRASLGTRYIPETNVDLPIRRDFLALTRHPLLQKEIDGWCSRVAEQGGRTASAVRATRADTARARTSSIASAVDALTGLFAAEPATAGQAYPIDAWKCAVSTCLDVTRETLTWSFGLPSSEPGPMGVEPERWARHALHDLFQTLRDIDEALSSERWRMANANAVLLTGPAGVGKSHLLADIVSHHLQENAPAVLLLGAAFVDDELRSQINKLLDRSPTEQFRHFLGALDAAAQAAGMNALFCIDALNERHGVDVWRERLAAFLKDFEAFPRLRVVLSCRSTYVSDVIPPALASDELLPLEHKGFAGDGGEAANRYLDMRGIVRPGAPSMLPEFDNPLFLRTICDALEASGATAIPRGLQGVTSIFKFYTSALAESVRGRMKLDPHQNIVPRAISEFARLLLESRSGYVEIVTATAHFDAIFPSGGRLENSLLAQLENEGLLTVELVPQGDGSSASAARFTFERFSDHAIASHLLGEHLDEGDVRGSFRPDSPLGEFVFGPRSHGRAGVIEAIAIQLPERAGVEIPDLDAGPSSLTERAFVESLLWREQSSFTDRTFQLAQELMDEDRFNALRIAIATEPSNKFNALMIHRQLINQSMVERDAWWSIHLAVQGVDGPIETLISWAARSGHERIDDDRAHLAATMLTWFLTASHREIRDKATKALACILSGRLALGARLLDQFAGVNDLYVLERLLAACYGAALQGRQVAGLAELAQTVYGRVFSDGTPPPNALLRDHALGILEYAAHRDVLAGSVDMTLARPPYRSPWPIEHVPDQLIDYYTEQLRGSIFHDDIAGSTVHGGDFARYVVEHIAIEWSPAPIGDQTLPTELDMVRSWQDEFTATATDPQLEALDAYAEAAIACKSVHHGQSGPETARLADAERALKSTMTGEQWEEFRVRARDMIRHPQSRRSDPNSLAHFDIGWARRWICKRAHELGWTSRQFGMFDRHQANHDRNDHRVERIGKKYQWLALHELVARMADNLAFLGGFRDQESGHLPTFKGARQVGLRDIDPSLLITRTHYDGWAQWERTWWVPFDPRLRPIEPLERLAWLHSDSDIINCSTLIDLVEPQTPRRWLALDGFAHWTGRAMRGGLDDRQRDTWFRLRCMVVRREHRDLVVKSLEGRSFLENRSLPKMELPFDFYLGEYLWSADLDPEDATGSFHGWRPPAPALPTVATFACERGGYDYSIDRTIRIEMPAPWLAEAMGLSMEGGQSPAFIDSRGVRMFFDPSVFSPGPSAALVDREAFLRLLDHRRLAAIWVVSGQKSAYGRASGHMGFGGQLTHTKVYFLEDGEWKKRCHEEWLHPTEDQLQTMLEGAEVPPWIETSPHASPISDFGADFL